MIASTTSAFKFNSSSSSEIQVTIDQLTSWLLAFWFWVDLISEWVPLWLVVASQLLQGWVTQDWLWEWPWIFSWPWWSASNTFCYLNNCTGQNEADWWQRSFPHVWWQLWVNNTDWSGTMANMKQKEEKLTFDFRPTYHGDHRTKRGEDDIWLLIDIKRVLSFEWKWRA